jgi:hypothetical protein
MSSANRSLGQQDTRETLTKHCNSIKLYMLTIRIKGMVTPEFHIFLAISGNTFSISYRKTFEIKVVTMIQNYTPYMLQIFIMYNPQFFQKSIKVRSVM